MLKIVLLVRLIMPNPQLRQLAQRCRFAWTNDGFRATRATTGMLPQPGSSFRYCEPRRDASMVSFTHAPGGEAVKAASCLRPAVDTRRIKRTLQHPES